MPDGGVYALVERVQDLDEVPAGAAVVAVTPEVEVACELRGIHATSLEDGIDAAEVEELGAGTFAAVERICELLDEHGGDAPERTPARWHFFHLKSLHDCLWIWALYLSRWLDRVDVKRVVSFAHPSYFALALDATLEARGVAHERRGGSVARPVRLPPHPAYVHPLGLRRRLRSLAGRSDRRRIVALDFKYSIPAIAAELAARGHDVAALALQEPLWRPRPRVLEAAAGDERLRRLFVWEGTDYWAAAEPGLRVLVERAFPEVSAIYDVALAYFRRNRTPALLLSVAAHPGDRAVCAAATAAGVPAIVSRHGEAGMREVRIVAYQDADVVSHALCWGRWEADWIARHVDREVETRVVGAPHGELAAEAPARDLVRHELGFESARPVVLYLPQPGAGDEWYVSRRVPTDVLNFRFQVAVLTALAAQSRFDVVVKEHPSVTDSPLEAWCEAKLPGRVRFLYGSGFAELVNLADVVVVDYASTSFLQSLFGSARIVVTDDPISRWEPGVREHLSAHGVRFVAPGDLTEVLLDIEPRTEPYPPDVREPLIAGGPGTAASRAAGAVLDIVGGAAGAR